MRKVLELISRETLLPYSFAIGFVLGIWFVVMT